MKHLLTLADLKPDELTALLDDAETFREVNSRPIPKVPALQGRTIANLFYEDSTRTRLSFEAAARRLSADVLTVTPRGTSIAKGESLKDTARTLRALGAQLFVLRHESPGAAHALARWLDVPVVNAGDGAHAHPTQALLDALTLRQALGELAGRRIALVGDIRHSRVARSNVEAWRLLGVDVTLVAPPTLLPDAPESWGVRVTTDLDAVLPELDAVYLLRVQVERRAGEWLSSVPAYLAAYQLTAARVARLPAHAVVLHPGPMIRGVEIADDVAELPRSLITRQVENGLAVRMAVLFRLLTGGASP